MATCSKFRQIKCLWHVNLTDLLQAEPVVVLSSTLQSLWRINGSVWCIKEKFQVVLQLPYAISTFRLFIKEKSCSRSTNAMCGAFVIPADLSHEIWSYPGNTATPLIRPNFYDPLVTVLIIYRRSTVCASYKDASLRRQQYPGRNIMLVKTDSRAITQLLMKNTDLAWKSLILAQFSAPRKGWTAHPSTQKIGWVLLLTTRKGRTIRKLMGEGGGRSTKKIFAQGKSKWKKTDTRQLILKIIYAMT